VSNLNSADAPVVGLLRFQELSNPTRAFLIPRFSKGALQVLKKGIWNNLNPERQSGE
jgi:hypothetical protein